MSTASPIFRVLAFDPDEMARRGRLGGERTAALHDSRELTTPGRQAFNARFEQAADPAAARRAYFAELGRLSAARRRARKASAVVA